MKLLALAALVPMAIGPLPQEQASLTLSLCLGGEINIPLNSDENAPVQRDCHQKGCHAGGCREKPKLTKC